MQTISRIRRTLALILVVVLGTMVVTGCGGKDAKKRRATTTQAAGTTESFLMLDGKMVNADGELQDDPRLDPTKPKTTKAAAKKTPIRTVTIKELPVPPLNADGTLVDGADPFASGKVQVRPVPIEDDPETTREIDQWGRSARRIDVTQWNAWMSARAVAPAIQDPDAPMNSMVKVLVEQCGGARTVASGVVMADQTVVTTVHAIENVQRRIRVAAAVGAGDRHLPAMIQYLDIDDDIAVLRVPGLTLAPLGTHVVTGTDPQYGRAYGVGVGGLTGSLRRVPVVVAMREQSIRLEQPDGFAEEISDRSVFPAVGPIDTGFSGGIVTATNDKTLAGGWGFHGLIRARVPYRNDMGGVLVPSRLITAALDANDQLDPWFERDPGGCPQWYR